MEIIECEHCKSIISPQIACACTRLKQGEEE